MATDAARARAGAGLTVRAVSTRNLRAASRICLVTPYDLAHDGGVNRHVLSLAASLRRVGHRVHVLGPSSGSVPSRCKGLPGVVTLAANGSVARVGALVSSVAVRRYLRAGAFDVIHVHEPWLPGIAHHAVRAGQVGAAALVGTFHSFAERQSVVSRLARRALGFPLRALSAGIAVSTAAAGFARAVFRGPIWVVPNGVDTRCFSAGESSVQSVTCAGSEQFGLGSDAVHEPLRVLFVGRHDEPRKGLVHLLQAAARLRLGGRAVRVIVAGPGDALPDLSLVRAANACFVGRLGDSALAEAYRLADVFCAPSTHGESFGLVLLEAMACGCPVVASDLRGYREAAGGAALLVPPGQPDALAAALARVADEQVLRLDLVACGHRRAHALAWDRVARDVCVVYASARAAVAAHPVGALV